MRKEIILSVDKFTLVKTGDHLIPYAWYVSYDEADPIYYHGSISEERAKQWAVDEGIMDKQLTEKPKVVSKDPITNVSDTQGDL